MQADKTTLADLAIFDTEEEQSVFHFMNFTRTVGGKDWLRFFISNPHDTVTAIQNTQLVVKKVLEVHSHWDTRLISNGTIMVIEKFFETAIDEMPHTPGMVNSFLYSIFSASDFSLVRYSVKHFIDFFTGLQQLAILLSEENNPAPLQVIIDRIQLRLNKPGLQELLQGAMVKDIKELPKPKILALGNYIKKVQAGIA